MCQIFSLFCILTTLRLELPPLLSVTEIIEHPKESLVCISKEFVSILMQQYKNNPDVVFIDKNEFRKVHERSDSTWVYKNATIKFNGSIFFCYQYEAKIFNEITMKVTRNIYNMTILIDESVYINLAVLYAVIAIQLIIVLLIIILFLYFICKRNKEQISTSISSHPGKRNEIDDKVLYAELEMNTMPSSNKTLRPIEESPYAQIMTEGQVIYAELELYANPRSSITLNSAKESPYAEIVVPSNRFQ